MTSVTAWMKEEPDCSGAGGLVHADTPDLPKIKPAGLDRCFLCAVKNSLHNASQKEMQSFNSQCLTLNQIKFVLLG